MNDDSSRFYERVPVFDRFTGIVDPARYQPLPDDWQLGLADVVQSTKAIREHRYKAVNMAGASVIAAVANALGNRDFRSCSAATARASQFRRLMPPWHGRPWLRPPRGYATSSILPCGWR